MILDNLSSHKTADARRAIEARKAVLMPLPAYSPDLNPIEKLFGKLKALVSKARERTLEGVWEQVARVLDGVTPEECRNYFASCGYGSI